MNKYIILSLLIGIVVLGVSSVKAESLEINGNGSDSSNGVVIDSGSVVEVHQDNKAEIKNVINTSTNTGSNKVNGSENGSIKTGNSSTTVKVTNILNNNISTVECCIEKVTTTPKPQVTTTPAPQNQTSSSSSSSSSENNPGSGSAIGGAPVLGLSDTSSENDLNHNIIITASSLCLIAFALSARGIFRG